MAHWSPSRGSLPDSYVYADPGAAMADAGAGTSFCALAVMFGAQLASGVASRFVASVRKNSAAGSKSGSGAGGFLAGKLRAA